KSKCDEQRPKCGLCWRLSVECVYREPQPTKKDKTMIYILQNLQRLENKFDTLYVSKPITPASNSDWSAPHSRPRQPGVTGTLGTSSVSGSHISSDSEVRPGARIGSQSSSPPDMLCTYQLRHAQISSSVPTGRACSVRSEMSSICG
ncbi:hypothetical protein E4T44_12986, partial [Aureobasidium sp. EXF-8845]